MNKFGNKPTTVDGIRFASQAEARRYQELKLLERGKKITELVLQPRFRIEINGVNVCTYVGDFGYADADTYETRVEDVKGLKTPVYKLKKALMKAVYGIEIQEVQA